jgi:arginase family enzyme
MDLGDIPIAADDSVARVHEKVDELLHPVIEAGVIPVTMGGDDSLCFAAPVFFHLVRYYFVR